MRAPDAFVEFATEVEDYPDQVRPVGVVSGQRAQLLDKVFEHAAGFLRAAISVTPLAPQVLVGPKPQALAIP